MAKPKYQEIVDELIKELSEGRLNQGDRFYSEAEIKDRFAVSSTTAVKVLNLLQEKNWVTRIKGRGTFVAKENHRRVVYLTDLRSCLRSLLTSKQDPYKGHSNHDFTGI